MTAHHSLADVAALIGEPTRAAMLVALLDGRAIPATELASAANLSAAATSLHLAKLTRGGLLTVRQEGRHRYYRLASADVVHALEALGVIATGPPPLRSLTPEQSALRAARTCYDHLAGVIAVALTETLLRSRVLRRAGEHRFDVTPSGRRWLWGTLSIDMSTLELGRRPLARSCLDWTERRPHVSGALGAAILAHFIERGWLAKQRGSRAVDITGHGRAAFVRLGLPLPG
jgi:DNA-binding transcriptional ArsR family regulator